MITAALMIPLVLSMLAIGYIIIRSLGWQLPRPQTLREFFLATFWIHPASVPKEKVVRNKVAWLVVVLLTYLVTTSIFF